ncbi:unnamed protein product [Closterium sp. NIES-54]
MFITLYFIVTRLPDSLRSVKDHVLSLDPTSLTIDLLQQHLLAAKTSAVAVGAARGTLRPPFFEGCSPSPLAPSYASASAADVSVAEDVGAAFASAKPQRQRRRWDWWQWDWRSACLFWRWPASAHRCFSRLDDAWRAEFGDDVELPRWADLLNSRIAIFDQDFDAILSAMYALSVSAEGDCYWCVPADPGIAATALGASESGTLPGTAPTLALHTFTWPFADITFDESVPFYHLFPYRSAPPPPPPLFLAPGPPPVDPLPPHGRAPSGVSQVEPLPSPVPVQVVVDKGAAQGAASGGAASEGAEPGGAESDGAETGGAEPGGVETGGAEPGDAEIGGGEPGSIEYEGVAHGGAASEGAESGGAEPHGAATSGGSAGASPRLSPQQLREWFVRRTRLRTGATGTGGAGAAGDGGTGVATGAGITGGTAVTGPRGARTWAPRARRSGAGGAGAGGAGVGGTGAGGAGVGGHGVGGAGAGGAGAVDPGGTVRPRPYFVPLLQQSGGLTERREPASRPVSPVHTARRVPRSRPPPVHGMHAMTLRPSSVPLRVPLPAPPESSLPESAAAFALVPELLDFAAACRLDYTTALVAESTFASPPSVGDSPTPRSYAEAITGPYSSQWQAAMDAEMASWKSTGTYVDEFPPPGANIVDGMWIFKVKRPPGSPPAFKARYFARGFSQRQGVDYFQTFSPTSNMTTLWVLLHIAAQRDYELHSLDFCTAFLQGSLHEEIWLRCPPGFTESFPAGPLALRLSVLFATTHSFVYQPLALSSTNGRVRRAEWSVPRACGLPHVQWDAAKRVLHYLCSTSRMGLVLGGQGPVVLTDHADASWDDDSATQRSSHGYTFSLGSGSVSWQSSRLSSVLISSCEAEIYAGAMAAQELRWLTYLLTDLGEQPRSPPVLYVDNKAMIALCQERRLEHRTKHIALRYFLARELQLRGQLRLAYVATRANTADIFTKALPPGDHQRFSTVLGLVPTLPHLFSS